MKKFLFYTLIVGVVGVVLAGLAGVALILWASQDLPSFTKISDYRPPQVTTVYARDGSIMGYLYDEKRFLITLQSMPENLWRAFLAAEDATFYSHSGIEPKAIVRAFIKNMTTDSTGGGSTITQQVVKRLLLTNEKSYERKLREAILAYRLESYLSKDDILNIYLNQIFLGSGAYGVESAARTYFGKHASELTLPECAVLAGLPQAPSKVNPYENPAATKDRQKYVLSRMRALNWITEEDYQAALAAPLNYKRMTEPSMAGAWYFEEVRRRLIDFFSEENVKKHNIPIDRYGRDAVYNAGLNVYTAMDPVSQAAGEHALRQGLLETSKSHGWQGALAHLTPAEYGAYLEKDSFTPAALSNAGWAKALITKIDSGGAELRLGAYKGRIAAKDMAWSRQLHRVLKENAAKDVQEAGLAAAKAAAEAAAKGVRAGLPQDALQKLAAEAGTQAWNGKYPNELCAPNPQAGQETIRLAFQAAVKAAEPLKHATDEALRDAAVEAARDAAGRYLTALRVDARGLEAGDVVWVSAVGALGTANPVGVPGKEPDAQDKKGVPAYTAATITPDEPIALCLEQVPAIEGALASIETENGDLVALVGGWSFSKSHFNRATQAIRQPGSSFKPIAYSAALDNGFTAGSMLVDAPFVIEGGQGVRAWRPENFDSKFLGRIILRTALAKSRNVCTVRVAQAIGMEAIVQRAHDLGIEGNIPPELAVSLGAYDVSPLTMAQAYTAFANQGELVRPRLLVAIKDCWDQPLINFTPNKYQAISKENAYIMASLLKDVVNAGTAAKARVLARPLGGKTGTTNESRDAWFIGFTPYLVTSVYMGYDDRKPMGGQDTGGRLALPVFVNYYQEIGSKYPPDDFVRPEDIVFKTVDAETGYLAGPGSSATLSLPFMPGTGPDIVSGSGLQKGQDDTRSAEDILRDSATFPSVP